MCIRDRMEPVAEAPAWRFAGDRDGAHQLADRGLPAEQVAALAHPATRAGRVRVELERAGVDRGPAGPGRRDLHGRDVHDVDTERRAVDHATAPAAAGRLVLAKDGRDADPVDVERHAGMVAEGRSATESPSGVVPPRS